MHSTRVKISVSLPRDLVARIDRTARSESRSRSRVLEDWLKKAARGRAELELREATAAYYDSLTPEDEQEERALSSAAAAAARRVPIDDPAPRRRRSTRR